MSFDVTFFLAAEDDLVNSLASCWIWSSCSLGWVAWVGHCVYTIYIQMVIIKELPWLRPHPVCY